MKISACVFPLALFASGVYSVPLENSDGLQKRAGPVTYDMFGNHEGSTSSYRDGEGKFVTAGDKAIPRVKERGNREMVCQTELWEVERKEYSSGWKKENIQIDCATTEQCSQGKANGQSQCQSWSLGVEMSFGIDIKIFQAGGSISFTKGEETCRTTELTGTCQWNDQQCHQIWSSSQETEVKGYVRRVCGVFDPRDNGLTLWSKDLTIRIPSGVSRMGCAAKCNDVVYPGDEHTQGVGRADQF